MFLSMDEIHKKYDGEWIYAIDCNENNVGTILGGNVVLHSPNRDNVIRAMSEYEKTVKTLTLFLYAGKIPEGISVLL